jgi:hypothetical protein
MTSIPAGQGRWAYWLLILAVSAGVFGALFPGPNYTLAA